MKQNLIFIAANSFVKYLKTKGNAIFSILLFSQTLQIGLKYKSILFFKDIILFKLLIFTLDT